MNKAGAILIGDNLIWSAIFNEIDAPSSGWSGLQWLETEQLAPKASRGASPGDVTLGATSTAPPAAQPNAIAFLGVTGSGLSNVRPQVNASKGWEDLPDYDLYELESVYQRHMVVILYGVPADATGWRLRWRGSSAVEIGSLYVGRALVDPSLADQGWSQEYPDRAERSMSEDGQLYSGETNTYRVLRIPQGTVDPRVQLGVVPHGQLKPLPAPSFSGAASYDPDTGVLTVESTAASASWSTGPLEAGNLYRLDYWYREAGDDASSSPRLVLAGSNEVLYGATPMPVGRRTLVFRPTTTVSSLTLGIGGSTGANTAAIKLLAISQVEDPGNIWAGDEMQSNLQSFYSRHGNSRPIIAMTHPSDPMVNRVTGIYGVIRDTVRTVDSGGQYTQTQLVLEEQR